MQRARRWVEEGLDYLEEDPDMLPDLGRVEHLQANGHYGWDEHIFVNEEWDRVVMEAFERGDVGYFKNTSYEEIKNRGGEGGYEILNWIAALGAVDGEPADILTYEAVYEFICGMGFITWHDSLAN